RLIEFATGFRAAPLALDAGWVPPSLARALELDPIAVSPEVVGVSVVEEPGRCLALPHDVRRAIESIQSHSPSDAAKWPTFTAPLRRLAGFLESLYQIEAPDIDTRDWREVLPLLELGRKFRGLGRGDMIELLRTLPMSVWELADDWFE